VSTRNPTGESLFANSAVFDEDPVGSPLAPPLFQHSSPFLIPRCPHWHGLPITEYKYNLHMHRSGKFDDHRVDTDVSPVLCGGWDSIGPMPFVCPLWRHGET
jgi:hypothetical protein